MQRKKEENIQTGTFKAISTKIYQAWVTGVLHEYWMEEKRMKICGQWKVVIQHMKKDNSEYVSFIFSLYRESNQWQAECEKPWNRR